MSVKTVYGDLLSAAEQTKAIPVNCIGVAGAGLALAWRQRYPAAYLRYHDACARGEVKLTSPLLLVPHIKGGQQWLMWATKQHWQDMTNLVTLLQSIEAFEKDVLEYGITSLGVPALGCGKGGLQWWQCGHLITDAFSSYPIPVTIYLRKEFDKHHEKSPTQATKTLDTL